MLEKSTYNHKLDLLPSVLFNVMKHVKTTCLTLLARMSDKGDKGGGLKCPLPPDKGGGGLQCPLPPTCPLRHLICYRHFARKCVHFPEGRVLLVVYKFFLCVPLIIGPKKKTNML